MKITIFSMLATKCNMKALIKKQLAF